MYKPVLSAEAVQEGLTCIESSTPLPDSNPLSQFFLLRQRLMQPAQLTGKHAELKVWRDVVEEILLKLLGEDRLTKDDHTKFIYDVFRLSHARVQAYAFLYYTYLRPELGIDMQEIAQTVNLVDRSLRRRRQLGIGHLTQALINREVEARQLHRVEVWRARIPFPDGRALFGREWLVERILDGLSNGAVLLTGIPGIGKTSLASAVAHAILPQVDDFYWMHLSAEFEVASQILEVLQTDETMLAAYLANHTVLMVLENVRQMPSALFNHARLLCTSETALADWDGVVIEIPPLDRQHGRAFFRVVQGAVSDEAFGEIYTSAAGVPGVMQEYARWMQLVPAEKVVDKLSIQAYFYRVWDGLSMTLKQVWLGASLLEFEPVEIESLFHVAEGELFELVQQHVLLVEAGYRISPSAKQFVQTQAPRLALDALVVAADVRQNTRGWLRLLLNGLHLYVAPETLTQLMQNLSWVIPQAGLWESWKTVMTYLKSIYHPTWVVFEEARYLRWRGQFEESLVSLLSVAQEMSQQGDFAGYGRALLETGIVQLYRYELTAALVALQDAEKIFRRLNNVAGIMASQKLQARVLMRSEPEKTLKILEHLAEQDAAAFTTACETLLLLGDTENAVKYAHHALERVERDSPHHGRALSTLAMALRAHRELPKAIDYQQQAVNMLGMTVDLVGLARARNNLGVLYYESQNPISAKSNWRQAYDLFKMIQDEVGLKTVEANLNASSLQVSPFS